MYHPREINSDPSWQDEDGIKIYTISAQNLPVNQAPYLARLAEVKRGKVMDWPGVPA